MLTCGRVLPLSIMVPTKPTTRTEVVQSNSGLSELREWLISQLGSYDYCEDDTFAVRLALEEAFYNAAKHGNRMDPSKKVEINLLIGSEKVEIAMTDAGAGFNPNAVPDCRLEENLYKTEGRGLLLIRSYMDLVEFNEVGNSIHMVKHKRQQQNDKEASCGE